MPNRHPHMKQYEHYVTSKHTVADTVRVTDCIVWMETNSEAHDYIWQTTGWSHCNITVCFLLTMWVRRTKVKLCTCVLESWYCKLIFRVCRKYSLCSLQQDFHWIRLWVTPSSETPCSSMTWTCSITYRTGTTHLPPFSLRWLRKPYRATTDFLNVSSKSGLKPGAIRWLYCFVLISGGRFIGSCRRKGLTCRAMLYWTETQTTQMVSSSLLSDLFGGLLHKRFK